MKYVCGRLRGFVFGSWLSNFWLILEEMLHSVPYMLKLSWGCSSKYQEWGVLQILWRLVSARNVLSVVFFLFFFSQYQSLFTQLVLCLYWVASLKLIITGNNRFFWSASKGRNFWSLGEKWLPSRVFSSFLSEIHFLNARCLFQTEAKTNKQSKKTKPIAQYCVMLLVSFSELSVNYVKRKERLKQTKSNIWIMVNPMPVFKLSFKLPQNQILYVL